VDRGDHGGMEYGIGMESNEFPTKSCMAITTMQRYCDKTIRPGLAAFIFSEYTRSKYLTDY